MTTVEHNVFANRAAEEKIDRISAQVEAELRDHLLALVEQKSRYVRAYVTTIVGPKTTGRPPTRMHPKLAELIRELALDVAVMDRGNAASAQNQRKAA